MTTPLELAIEDLGPSAAAPAPTDDYVYLAGRPPLKGYLDFRATAADGHRADRRTLVEEWRAAQRHILTLEVAEAGVADGAPILPLGGHLEHLRQELLDDPVFQRAFDRLPTDIAVVELDRLVVYQKHIDLSYVRLLKERLGPAPSDEEIFRACLPADHPHPETRWMKIQRDTWVCVSPSNDLRFLDLTRLDPSQVVGYPASGPLAGVVAVVVGFGSNFLHVIHAEGRLVLNNGSHRAYALRELGVTRVPCIVKHVASREELNAFATSKITRNPDLYLRHPRPPMLRDYFDPRLRRVVPVPRRTRQVRVTVRVEETSLPAL
jgi:hypothetical protein